MHLVYLNSKYKNVGQCVEDTNACLVVLAIWFEIGPTESLLYDIPLERLVKFDSEVKCASHLLRDVLVDQIIDDYIFYYQYHGSLTTPNCYEVVTWIVLNHRPKVTHSQLTLFRKLQTKGGQPLVDNFRPIQDTHGRQITMSMMRISRGPSDMPFDNNLPLIGFPVMFG